MPSSSSKTTQTEGLQLIFFTISPQVLLQIGTGPLLVAMLAGKAVAETLQAMGQASEEVFRGDRLPVLKFPVQTEAQLKQQ